MPYLERTVFQQSVVQVIGQGLTLRLDAAAERPVPQAACLLACLIILPEMRLCQLCRCARSRQEYVYALFRRRKRGVFFMLLLQANGIVKDFAERRVLDSVDMAIWRDWKAGFNHSKRPLKRAALPMLYRPSARLAGRCG